MKEQWILDVLADLKTFAKGNDMPALAEQLDTTRHVAMVELADVKSGDIPSGHGEIVGSVDRLFATGGSA